MFTFNKIKKTAQFCGCISIMTLSLVACAEESTTTSKPAVKHAEVSKDHNWLCWSNTS